MQEKVDLNKLSFTELQSKVQELGKAKEEIGKPKGMSYCIVRTYSAGVFAGNYDRKIKGKEGTVYNARRIWSWAGAASLSQLANEGTKNPEDCKFAQEVEEVDLKEIIEVIPCTEKAIENIKGVAIWQQ